MGETRKENERKREKTRENERKKESLIYSWSALVSLTLHGASGESCGSGADYLKHLTWFVSLSQLGTI